MDNNNVSFYSEQEISFVFVLNQLVLADLDLLINLNTHKAIVFICVLVAMIFESVKNILEKVFKCLMAEYTTVALRMTTVLLSMEEAIQTQETKFTLQMLLTTSNLFLFISATTHDLIIPTESI